MTGSPDPRPKRAASRGGTPLRRREPLRAKKSLADYSRAKGARAGEVRTCAAEGCDRTFYNYPSHNQRFCSRACAYPRRRKPTEDEKRRKSEATRGTRKGPANPNYRHGRRAGRRDREAERVWYAAAATSCQHPACPGTNTVLAQHHVVYEQKVRRLGGAVWDPRNSLTLCDSCHTSHHRRGSRVVPLSALRDANYAFAVELLGEAAYDYLRRRYTGDDQRLSAIIDRYYTPEDSCS